MNNVIAIFGNPDDRTALAPFNWLRTSKVAAIAWLAVRVWIGIMWIQAGWAKIFGAENASFLHNNGKGVAGFAAHGVAAYSWWKFPPQFRRAQRQLDRGTRCLW